MLNSKSQISLEYLILIGFIILAVILPSIFFLYSIANESVHGTINTQKVLDLGNGLIKNAKQLYYLGLYSKKTMEYDVPQNMDEMFLVKIDDGTETFYYVGIIIDDNKVRRKYYFQSDVPLTSDDTSSYVDEIDPFLPGADLPECNPPSTCTSYMFIDSAIRPGQKKFKIETVMVGTEAKVSIVPIILT